MTYDFEFNDRFFTHLTRLRLLTQRRIAKSFDLNNIGQVSAAIGGRLGELATLGNDVGFDDEYKALRLLAITIEQDGAVGSTAASQISRGDIPTIFFEGHVMFCLLPHLIVAPALQDWKMGVGVAECQLDWPEFQRYLQQAATPNQFSAVRSYVRLSMLWGDNPGQTWSKFWNVGQPKSGIRVLSDRQG